MPWDCTIPKSYHFVPGVLNVSYFHFWWQQSTLFRKVDYTELGVQQKACVIMDLLSSYSYLSLDYAMSRGLIIKCKPSF